MAQALVCPDTDHQHMFSVTYRGTSQGTHVLRIKGLVREGETVGKTREVDELGERELVLVVSVGRGKE